MISEYTLRRRVAFSETDASGLTHFSNFFRYMEDCEHSFLRSLNQDVFTQNAAKLEAWPRVDVACSYKKPLRFDDLFSVRLLISKIGKRSVHYQFQIRSDGDSDLCALGRMIVVYAEMNKESGALKSCMLPAALRAQLCCVSETELINE